MQALHPTPDLPEAHQPPQLTDREKAEKNRAHAVHMEVARTFGWPNNRHERRAHEKRVRKILDTLPPLVDSRDGAA